MSTWDQLIHWISGSMTLLSTHGGPMKTKSHDFTPNIWEKQSRHYILWELLYNQTVCSTAVLNIPWFAVAETRMSQHCVTWRTDSIWKHVQYDDHYHWFGLDGPSFNIFLFCPRFFFLNFLVRFLFSSLIIEMTSSTTLHIEYLIHGIFNNSLNS